MKRRDALCWALGLGMPQAWAHDAAKNKAIETRTHTAPAAPAGAVWQERIWQGFGTTLHLSAAHADLGHLNHVLDEAVALQRHIQRQMSLFDADSALSRLNRNGHLTEADPHLVQVLRLALQVAQRSGGAFDPTVQPLWALWEQARQWGRLPTAAELQAARARVGWQQVHLRRQAGASSAGSSMLSTSIHLPTGVALTLNGIAQGHAAQALRDLLHHRGIAHALLNTGEWATLGAPQAGGAWQLALADPHRAGRTLGRLRVDGRAIASSDGSQHRFDVATGQHHILDPRSGRSPRHIHAVAVWAHDAALADALTKVLFMDTPQQALRLARQWRVDAVVVARDASVWATQAGLVMST